MKKKYLLILAIGLLIASCTGQEQRLEIVVHRGANKLAPENTMAATKKCIELGVEYVEIDVRESKDGLLYILYDKTLDRTMAYPVNVDAAFLIYNYFFQILRLF